MPGFEKRKFHSLGMLKAFELSAREPVSSAGGAVVDGNILGNIFSFYADKDRLVSGAVSVLRIGNAVGFGGKANVDNIRFAKKVCFSLISPDTTAKVADIKFDGRLRAERHRSQKILAVRTSHGNSSLAEILENETQLLYNMYVWSKHVLLFY